MSRLHPSNPTNPLFVFETNPARRPGRGDRLFQNGVILENVDGFNGSRPKFVLRSVPHALSMKTSIAPDVGDLHDQPRSSAPGGQRQAARRRLPALLPHRRGHAALHPDARARGGHRLPAADRAGAGLDARVSARARAHQRARPDAGQPVRRAGESRQGGVHRYPSAVAATSVTATRARTRRTVARTGTSTPTPGSPPPRTSPQSSTALPCSTVGFGGKGVAHPNFDANGDGVADWFRQRHAQHAPAHRGG